MRDLNEDPRGWIEAISNGPKHEVLKVAKLQIGLGVLEADLELSVRLRVLKFIRFKRDGKEGESRGRTSFPKTRS